MTIQRQYTNIGFSFSYIEIIKDKLQVRVKGYFLIEEKDSKNTERRVW